MKCGHFFKPISYHGDSFKDAVLESYYCHCDLHCFLWKGKIFLHTILPQGKWQVSNNNLSQAIVNFIERCLEAHYTIEKLNLILNTKSLRTTLRAHLSSIIICLFQPRSTLSKQCLTFVGLGIASNNDLIKKTGSTCWISNR